MTYELKMFDELVNGSLSPFYTLETDRKNNFTVNNSIPKT
jgi:hypothetical protein